MEQDATRSDRVNAPRATTATSRQTVMMMEPLQGQFLIASPYLLDPNFHRTVVLLIHHSEEGTFGLIVNRPTDSRVDDFWHTVSTSACESRELLHVGGPVSGPLMSLHTNAKLAEIEVLPGLYFAAQRANIERLVCDGEGPYRLFIGHSGWTSGQLEGELAEGSWFTKPASVLEVFGDETELWQHSTEKFGTALLIETLRLRHVPADPVVN